MAQVKFGYGSGERGDEPPVGELNRIARDAVDEIVRMQRDCGVDVVSVGELSGRRDGKKRFLCRHP